jgi:hypothetical protein
MADMHCMHWFGRWQYERSVSICQERFPSRWFLERYMFSRIPQCLSDNGTFVLNQMDQGRPQSLVNTPDLEERVLCHLEEEPGTSARRIAAAESLPKHSCANVT